MSLERLFDWGGEQLAMYCGEDLGALIVITLNKYIQLVGA
jgi:Ca2+:H+ antiporter